MSMGDGIILKDGTILQFKTGLSSGYIWLFADLNGTKGPNKLGRDVFVFDAYRFASPAYRISLWSENASFDNLKNSGSNLTDTNNRAGYGCSKDNKFGYYSGFYCGQLIQRSGWKIPKDYPW